MAKYECDRCGACYKGPLIVEAYQLDLLREPKLATADNSAHYQGMDTDQLMAELEQYGKCLILAGGDRGCSFLGADNLCTIYPARPNVCVAMEAGGDQCQLAREAHGLSPLRPVAD